MNMDHKDRQDTDIEASLSALLDGELSELELRRVLREARDNPRLLETWERYNLARAALRGEPVRQADPSLSRRIADQVAAEPSPGQRRRFGGIPRAWLVPAGRLAVAASVTMAVFLGMQSLFQGGSGAPEGQPGMQQASTQQAATEGSVDPEAQQRLNEYIQSVSIPHPEEAGNQEDLADITTLLESTRLRPVSDRELIRIEEEPAGDDAR